MNLEYVHLLNIQRELQGLPRGMGRFREYLRTIMNAEDGQLELPSLIAMNPMGKEHVTVLLDDLIAMNADEIAAGAVAEASARLSELPGDYKVGLVISDDLMGGWTNRYDCEYKLRFPEGPAAPTEPRLPRWVKHFWITVSLWSSEPAAERTVRESVLSAAYRTAYLRMRGRPETLRDMLAQEGEVMAAADCAGPRLDPEDLEYTRAVLTPFLDATDKRTAIECLFGDAAARSLGFTPRGLSPRAGLALALHDARERDPETLPRRK